MKPLYPATILLHTCCSPCVCYPFKYLSQAGFQVTLFFYNPNIYPREEYFIRLGELQKYLSKLPALDLIVGEYDHHSWLDLVRGLETEPERGPRCDLCYESRLKETAVLAKHRGFDYFGSTLSISPHKNAAKISEIGNRLAAEHVELAVDDPDAMFALIRHAGSVFLGRHTPEAIGDYVAGPNHVLPTGRRARFASGLSVLDFMKRTSFLSADMNALAAIGPAGIALANAEGLPAHAQSIEMRLK